MISGSNVPAFRIQKFEDGRYPWTFGALWQFNEYGTHAVRDQFSFESQHPTPKRAVFHFHRCLTWQHLKTWKPPLKVSNVIPYFPRDIRLFVVGPRNWQPLTAFIASIQTIPNGVRLFSGLCRYEIIKQSFIGNCTTLIPNSFWS